ncbi:MAG TPA: hypothetical protein VNV86_22020 [Candidatus Acidoferrum sp.]|nr:hypothetical protein [Candidatus Acidoferrum sp.]
MPEPKRYNRSVDQIPPRPKADFVMERYGRLAQMDRSFDIEYWQRLGPEAIFEAAWQMVVDAHSRDELQLRRTVEHFHRKQR